MSRVNVTCDLLGVLHRFCQPSGCMERRDKAPQSLADSEHDCLFSRKAAKSAKKNEDLYQIIMQLCICRSWRPWRLGARIGLFLFV